MLPTWAAVVIALGGAALGAFSGGLAAYLALKSTEFSLIHQEREAWRTRLINASNEFIAIYMSAFTSLDSVLAGTAVNREQALRETQTHRDEAQKLGIRVSLLFGQETPADKAMESLIVHLTKGLRAAERECDEEARAEWQRANDAHIEFLKQAYSEIRR